MSHHASGIFPSRRERAADESSVFVQALVTAQSLMRKHLIKVHDALSLRLEWSPAAFNLGSIQVDTLKCERVNGWRW